MSIKKMKKEELELLSYKDITYLLLEEKGKINTKDLFKTITTLLELPNSIFETKIGEYYTTLTTDKRFIILEDGTWDLRDRHTSDKVVIAVDEDDETEEEINESKDDIGEDEDEEENSFDANIEDDFDDSDDGLKDLVIMDESELELEE